MMLITCYVDILVEKECTCLAPSLAGLPAVHPPNKEEIRGIHV